MATPHALILRAPGTNCDHEVQHAFEMVGGRATRLHLNALRDDPRQLRNYQILVLPGGFSYGDDIGAGKVQALYMQHFLADANITPGALVNFQLWFRDPAAGVALFNGTDALSVGFCP